MKKSDLKLYLVTNRYEFSDKTFLTIVEEACKAGITLLQLREKNISTLRYYKLAKAVKAITDHYRIPLIIDDRLDICLAVEADGLHIGDDDLPVAKARKLLGKDKILGVSAKTVERSLEAESQGADYLGCGAIFPTQTKNSPHTKLQTLKEIAETVHIPVVAIGGITPKNINQLHNIPIAGAAVVSAIMLANDVQKEVKQFQKALEFIE
ncbi:thiamine phosphate synthase [Streptococcus caviae]|uniref:thiamine phosphate synthase n=1 Tax=Streptococcus sp. 'caviae' TaxID=1915004 RepID=UPI00094BC4B1|nr:thiamine phosphate synthase [Streptococcus sp. 'caviae']OLN83836.1 thiamine-phosphate diphosphorylase [Streptococcus sp. 'caviae']